MEAGSQSRMLGGNSDSLDIQVHVSHLKKVMKSSGEGEPESHFWTRNERRLCLPLLLLGAICIYICRQALPITSVEVSKEFGWTKSQTGMALSCFFWGYMLTQIPAGTLSDRIGGVTVATIAACIWVPITFFLPVFVYFSPSNTATLWLIAFYRVTLGSMQGFYYPCLASALAKRVDKGERAFSYALCASGSQFGVLLAGGIGSLLLESFNWRSVFYIMGLLSFIWLSVMITMVLPLEKQKTQQSLTSGENSSQKASHEVHSTHVPWRLILTKVSFWAIIVCHVCSTNAYFIVVSWLPTYFHETFPSEKGWVFNVVPWLVAVPSRWFGGYLADKLISKGYGTTLVRKFMECLGMLGPAICLLLISYTKDYSMALLIMATSIGMSSFHSSGVMVNPQDIAPSYAGSVFGVMNAAGSIPGFMGVYIAGYILETTKSWAAVFFRTSMICFGGWFFYMIFGSSKQVVP